jgi:hypothetical protein
MATVTSTRASSTFPVAGGVGNAQSLKVAHGEYEQVSALAADTIIEFCRVPKGAVVVGGRYKIEKIESSTSGATFDMDIGWGNNSVNASDTDGFGNFGAPSFAAVSGVKPEADRSDMPLAGVLGITGPKAFGAETTIIGHVVASATNFVTGTAFVEVYYYVP